MRRKGSVVLETLLIIAAVVIPLLVLLILSHREFRNRAEATAEKESSAVHYTVMCRGCRLVAGWKRSEERAIEVARANGWLIGSPPCAICNRDLPPHPNSTWTSLHGVYRWEWHATGTCPDCQKRKTR